MNAIELLEQQHRDVEELFNQLADAGDNGDAQHLFNRLADALAVHTRIEEEIFYPECRRADLEELVRESVDEHHGTKQLLTELLEMAPGSGQFAARCQELHEMVGRHVEFEESELLPRAERYFGARLLEDLGDRMDELATRMQDEGEPRYEVPQEMGHVPTA